MDSMDEVAVTELHEATAGLGNWHQVNDKWQYLVNREDCISCLRDLRISLRHCSAEAGHPVRLKLGEWKVLPNHLVPLFTSYREDVELSSLVLGVLVLLTDRCDLAGTDQLTHLEHLQDYKESFAKKDVFIILMGMLLENMEADDAEAENATGDKRGSAMGTEIFNAVLALLRNLVSVPDPSPHDAGFTPMRRNLQMVYIRNFHDEGVLDFFLLLGEGLAEEDSDKKAWALADIIYHICTHVDPESLTSGSKEKDKKALNELFAREQIESRLRMPLASRHSRFGTSIINRNAQGGTSISSSVIESASVSKGGRVWRREFHDPHSRSEKKQNVFHDPFFVDLEEGAVRDHNQLNAHLKNGLESAKAPLGEKVIAGLSKFFEEFIQSCFSSLVHILRSTLGASPGTAAHLMARGAQANQPQPGGPFDRPKLLNFISWFLEFHRQFYGAQASTAKKQKKPAPFVDIASIQGAIDLDMIQFTTSRLREYGKDSNMHVSMLVMVLRTLAQQIKTIDLVVDSKDTDTRDCGEILTQNMIKDDVMANTAWVMKNFKTSSHDPRIMSYSVEIFHYMLRLMKTLSDRKGHKLEFQVERTTARFLKRTVTTMEEEVAGLAEARVIENLFHLLEKYKKHSPQLSSMLVKLIYAMIRVRRENIVVFFELSYFTRIQRICADPLVRDQRQGRRYKELVELLRFILRQFFKCAGTNKLAFVELIFRKVPENQKDSLLESHTAEFAAILDNYENEQYARVLEKMRAGETLNALKNRQRALQEGTLPWTEQEDALLKSRYPAYAQHPLCAELLAAELPEETLRTGAKVRKRLIELGLIVTGQRGTATRRVQPDDPGTRLDAEIDGMMDVEPSLKKARVDSGPAGIDETELEMDLERLLDEAMDAEDSLQVGDPNDQNVQVRPESQTGASDGFARNTSPMSPHKDSSQPRVGGIEEDGLKKTSDNTFELNSCDGKTQCHVEETRSTTLPRPVASPQGSGVSQNSCNNAQKLHADSAEKPERRTILASQDFDLEGALSSQLEGHSHEINFQDSAQKPERRTILASQDFDLEGALASQLEGHSHEINFQDSAERPEKRNILASQDFDLEGAFDSLLEGEPDLAASKNTQDTPFDLEGALLSQLDAEFT